MVNKRRLLIGKTARNALKTIGVLFIAFFALNSYLASGEQPRQLRFDKFVNAVNEGRVKKVMLKDRSHVVQATYVNGQEFETNIPEAFDAPQLLLDYRVPTTIDRENSLDWIGVVMSIAPLIILAYYLGKISRGISELDRKIPEAD